MCSRNGLHQVQSTKWFIKRRVRRVKYIKETVFVVHYADTPVVRNKLGIKRFILLKLIYIRKKLAKIYERISIKEDANNLFKLFFINWSLIYVRRVRENCQRIIYLCNIVYFV